MAKVKSSKKTIPEELRKLKQWVALKYGPSEKNGRTPEMPLDPKTRESAKTNDPKTWGSFQEAMRLYVNANLGGVGFVFRRDDPYCGIVLNNCRNKRTGKIKQWALGIIKDIGSYSEVSTSGTGVKIIAEGKLPGPSKRNGKIEMYDHCRYFAITGQRLNHFPKKLRKRSKTVKRIYNESFKKIAIVADIKLRIVPRMIKSR